MLTVRLADRRGGHNDTHNRLQRGVGDIQEPEFQRLGTFPTRVLCASPAFSDLVIGFGRPNIDSALLAVLLCQYGGRHIRHRLDRH